MARKVVVDLNQCTIKIIQMLYDIIGFKFNYFNKYVNPIIRVYTLLHKII